MKEAKNHKRRGTGRCMTGLMRRDTEVEEELEKKNRQELKRREFEGET